MGAAYYVVLNANEPGFDTTIDGKALSRHSRPIDRIAKQLGFKSLDEYCSQSPEEARLMMASIMGFDGADQLPPDAEATLASMPPEQWYDAEHGLDYASQLAAHIRLNPQAVKDPEAVLDDLQAMSAVLTEAKKRGLKWHLQVDL